MPPPLVAPKCSAGRLTDCRSYKLPLRDLLRAKVADIPVQADDIIYVPASRLNTALNAGALLSTLGTTAIYRVPRILALADHTAV